MEANDGSEEVMLKSLGSRLTYANVVATGALFVALGGGAYALSGVPDSGGVFHGCVSKKTGGLRVVASARSCHATKRRHGRVVDPGEFAVAWNQKGQPGTNGSNGSNGIQGVKGDKGDQGQQGPGATTFTTTLPVTTSGATLATLTNGITLQGSCGANNVSVEDRTTSLTTTLQDSGTVNGGNPPATFPEDSNNGTNAHSPGSMTHVDLDVLARDSALGDKFARIDVHGSAGGASGPCTFWGMITPSS
jgi:hypothetical protein